MHVFLVRNQQGFTLIEIIMVIVISSILAVGSTLFISRSAKIFVTAPQRLSIATAASLITERISRDIRSALPNSIRTFEDGGNSCLELIPIVSSSEYLSIPIASAQSSFQAIEFVAATGSESGYVAVYPSSVNEVYKIASNTVTQVMATASVPSVNLQTITFNSGTVKFPAESPTRRFFLTTQPVAYCEDAAGRVWRYSDYGFHDDSALSLPPALDKRVVIGNRLSPGSLTFNIIPAQLQRNAVVRISLDVISPSDESVQVAQEVQLRNVP